MCGGFYSTFIFLIPMLCVFLQYIKLCINKVNKKNALVAFSCAMFLCNIFTESSQQLKLQKYLCYSVCVQRVHCHNNSQTNLGRLLSAE